MHFSQGEGLWHLIGAVGETGMAAKDIEETGMAEDIEEVEQIVKVYCNLRELTLPAVPAIPIIFVEFQAYLG